MHYPEFRVDDPTVLRKFIEEFPLATIIVIGADNMPQLLFAPVIFAADAGDDTMEFHVATGNPAFSILNAARSVTLAFNGPNAHISPSWYEDRFANGDRSRTAPTWDYTSVQVQGDLAPIAEEDFVDHLARLTARFENRYDPAWGFDEIDPNILRKWLPHIKGYRLSPVSMQGIFKLSQEQAPEDQEHVIRHLERRGTGFDLALAKLIKEQSPRP